jgi:hypothetical protein
MPDYTIAGDMPDSTSPTLEFRLESSPAEEGLVLAQDFVAFLSKALEALKKLQHERDAEATIQYRIVELEIGSAVVALRPEGQGVSEAPAIFGEFLEAFAAVRDNTLHTKRFSPATQKAFRALVKPLRKSHLRLISVRSDSTEYQLREGEPLDLRAVGAPDTHAMGRISGFIDAINVHKEPVFFLYPEIGPTRLRCVFDRTKLDEVRAALKKFVTVNGMIEYGGGGVFPTRVTVETLRRHPDAKDLPPLSSFFGVLPDLTGGVSSVQYVRQRRDVEA